MKRRQQGFLLLPVLLLLSVVAAAAYLTQREGQLSLAGEQRRSDADKARAAAEAGLHRAVHEANRQGCGGDYPIKEKPVVDTSFDGASYSAYASEKDGSPVDITSVGSSGNARVTLVRQGVEIHSGTPQTMVLQPDSTGLDTSLKVGSSTAEPDATSLLVQPRVSEALLAFNLNAFPKGSHITSAQLSLRITDLQGSGDVSLHRVQSAWTENATVSNRNGTDPWVQAAGDAHPSAVASAKTQGLGWMSWTITDLVDGWFKGRWPNHGLLLRGTGLQSLGLASSDYPTAALRPRLVVTFQAPCNWSPPVLKQTLVPVADATLSESTPTLNDGSSDTLRLLNGAKELRLVMQFDTSTIVKSKTIKKATLRLSFTGLSGGVPTPQAVDLFARWNEESWDESRVTWKKRDASNDWNLPGAGVWVATQARTVTLPKDSVAGTVVEIDAKEWVAWWTESTSYNQGILIRLPNAESNTLTFGSRESLTSPPELVIEYE